MGKLSCITNWYEQNVFQTRNGPPVYGNHRKIFQTEPYSISFPKISIYQDQSFFEFRKNMSKVQVQLKRTGFYFSKPIKTLLKREYSLKCCQIQKQFYGHFIWYFLCKEVFKGHRREPAVAVSNIKHEFIKDKKDRLKLQSLSYTSKPNISNIRL